MSITIVTAPTAEPVTLDEAKLHLRVDGTDDEDLITSLILVARRTVEQISNRRLITQTWNLLLEGFPGSTVLELPRSLAPLVSVTHIKYYDAADQPTTYNSTNYVVDVNSQPARIILKSGSSWPSDVLRVANGVEIQVVVGFGDDAEVPQEYKQAMFLLLGHWYENREQIITGTILTEIPWGVSALLWLDRNVPI